MRAFYSAQVVSECLGNATTHQVDLWWADLDLAEPSVEASARLLTPSELARAERMMAPADRARAVVARALLRRLLGRLIGMAPALVPLRATPEGKPELAGTPLCFNTSRSAGRVLIATSWTMAVGVDLEAVRPHLDTEAIAARFFAPAERAALASIDPATRPHAAYQCWSCKEAYVKGTGVGLSGSTSTVTTWVPGQASTTVGDWRVCAVEAGPDFVAAVAGRSVRRWEPGVPRAL